MPRYKVTANVGAELVFSVSASNAEDAKEKVNDSMGVSAKLFDLPDDEYEVLEDCITEVHSMDVEKDDDYV